MWPHVHFLNDSGLGIFLTKKGRKTEEEKEEEVLLYVFVIGLQISNIKIPT